MNIYISNRQNRIIASASNDLPQGNKIIADRFSDDVSTGVKTLEITFTATRQIRECAVPGNFVLVGGTDIEPDAYLLFQIITATFDTASAEVSLYCEDAGMDLINKTVGEWKPTADVTIESAMITILGTDLGGWTINYNVPKSTKKGATYFDYTSEESALTRLQSVLEKFECEMYFTYDIKGLDIIQRTINILNARGDASAPRVFHYGTDVENIVERQSIEELATAFILYGQDANGSEKALKSFSDYATYKDMTITPSTSTFSGKRKHTYKISGNKVYCTDASSLWGSVLAPDGEVSQVKKTEYKNAKTLIAYALTEIEKHIDTAVEYDVTFYDMPNDINVGDTIRIADDIDDTYLEARILAWEYSDTNVDFRITLGNFVELKGSKAEAVIPVPPVTRETAQTIYSDTEPAVSDYVEGDVWVKTTTTDSDIYANETFLHDGTEWKATTLAPPTIGSSDNSSLEFGDDGIGFLGDRAQMFAELINGNTWININADNLFFSDTAHGTDDGEHPYLMVNGYNRAEMASGYAPDTWHSASVLALSNADGAQVVVGANNALVEVEADDGGNTAISLWSNSLKWNGRDLKTIACCSANSTESGTVSTSNTPTKVALNRFNAITDESAFEFSNGGIRCKKSGTIQINASLYIRVGTSSAATGTSGCYIYLNGAEVASNYSYTNNAYNTKGCTKIINVSAGDVITLMSRTSAAGVCYPGNVATYLECIYLS